MGQKIKLNNVRIAFCQSIWPGAAEEYQNNGVPRHSATFLVGEDSKASIDGGKTWKPANDAIEAAILAAAKEKWTKPGQAEKQVVAVRGNSNKFCYTDGDLKEYDGFEGKMALAAHRKASDGAPTIIDRDKTPLKQTDARPYAGCYVNAVVEIYAQDGQNSGIRCGLMGIQFYRDGDSFGGAGKAKDDDFEDLGVDPETMGDLDLA
jgi:hypothetical protein